MEVELYYVSVKVMARLVGREGGVGMRGGREKREREGRVGGGKVPKIYLPVSSLWCAALRESFLDVLLPNDS